ncbi:unnamed protein product, partial [Larinioides sclopetarius]
SSSSRPHHFFSSQQNTLTVQREPARDDRSRVAIHSQHNFTVAVHWSNNSLHSDTQSNCSLHATNEKSNRLLRKKFIFCCHMAFLLLNRFTKVLHRSH